MSITDPAHYKDLEIEPFDYIHKNKFEFWRGQIIRYVSRAGRKNYIGTDEQNELADLRKAQWFLERRIEELRSRPDIAKAIIIQDDD